MAGAELPHEPRQASGSTSPVVELLINFFRYASELCGPWKCLSGPLCQYIHCVSMHTHQ